jgi:hypothetical protein
LGRKLSSFEQTNVPVWFHTTSVQTQGLLFQPGAKAEEPALCKERERLTSIYIAAVAKSNEVAGGMASQDAWGDIRRNEMMEMQRASLAALRELDRHISEHGC